MLRNRSIRASIFRLFLFIHFSIEEISVSRIFSARGAVIPGRFLTSLRLCLFSSRAQTKNRRELTKSRASPQNRFSGIPLRDRDDAYLPRALASIDLFVRFHVAKEITIGARHREPILLANRERPGVFDSGVKQRTSRSVFAVRCSKELAAANPRSAIFIDPHRRTWVQNFDGSRAASRVRRSHVASTVLSVDRRVRVLPLGEYFRRAYRASIELSRCNFQSGTNVETRETLRCRWPDWNLEINSPRIEVDESGDELSFSPMPGLELVFS